jgi:hypothetical protein
MTKFIQFIAVIAACLFLQGCSTTGTYATPGNAEIASALVTQNALIFVADNKRCNAAAYAYTVATAVRSLSGGTVPTPSVLAATIELFVPADPKWTVLATNLSGIYGALYPQIVGNPALALKYLEAIAAGVEHGAQPYLCVQPLGTPIHQSPFPDYSAPSQ